MQWQRQHGLWPALLIGATLATACGGGGRKAGSLESGWVGAWDRARGAAPADSQLAHAGNGGAVVSPIEASTERLAARTRPAAHGAERNAARASGAARSGHMREAVVRSALDQLKFAEAKNFRLKRNYTGDITTLDYHRPAGTIVRIVWSNKWGWAALAADSAVPGQYCAMYVGSVPEAVTPDSRHWGKPGQAYCDGRTDEETLGRSVLYGDETPDQTLARFAMTMMPTNLMQLAISQDSYRKIQYTYARRIEPMALQYGWEPGVRVKMLFANSEGWAAEATYDLLPGRSCVIWGGKVPRLPATTGDKLVAEDEGVPVCDE
jgi:uncharacterized protein (DUF1778 family)